MNQDLFKITFCELDYLKEDMYQAEYEDFIVDAGYYNGFIRIIIVKDREWDNPVEQVSFIDSVLIIPIIDILKQKIINGYYSGFYEPNKGLGKEV